jgi:hypothetical protein
VTAPTLPPRLAGAAEGTDVRGWLAFAAPLPEPYATAEDSTQGADSQRWFQLPATDGWLTALWNTVDADELRHYRKLTKQLLQQVGSTNWRNFARPATPTEKILLEALGYPLPDNDILITCVTWPTRGIRSRRWPQIETLLESM